MKYFEIMKRASDDVGMELNEEKYNKFIKYMDLVIKWNEKINLTAITEEEEFIKKHFIDCIKVFKSDEIKAAKSIIDVGTGAGFPGIPIAIMDESKEICLLDSLNKRVKVLDIVINELGLNNVYTIHSRAEDGARDAKLREKFDVAVSRAVANMAVLAEFCLPYVKISGDFIALKGPAIDEELANSKNAIGTLGGKLKNVIELEIEDTDLKHNIVVINKIKTCSMSYPRKAGLITKNPLR
jgi:16S rRNA (guanine527-N7)-methyltransferase